MGYGATYGQAQSGGSPQTFSNGYVQPAPGIPLQTRSVSNGQFPTNNMGQTVNPYSMGAGGGGYGGLGSYQGPSGMSSPQPLTRTQTPMPQPQAGPQAGPQGTPFTGGGYQMIGNRMMATPGAGGGVPSFGQPGGPPVGGIMPIDPSPGQLRGPTTPPVQPPGGQPLFGGQMFNTPPQQMPAQPPSTPPAQQQGAGGPSPAPAQPPSPPSNPFGGYPVPAPMMINPQQTQQLIAQAQAPVNQQAAQNIQGLNQQFGSQGMVPGGAGYQNLKNNSLMQAAIQNSNLESQIPLQVQQQNAQGAMPYYQLGANQYNQNRQFGLDQTQMGLNFISPLIQAMFAQ